MTDLPTDLDELRAAARRAERWSERLERASRPSSPPAEPAPFDALERWVRAFAGGDRAALARRLGWDGIQPQHAATVFEASGEPNDDPSWLSRALAWGVVAADLRGRGDAPRLDDLPFPELWRPWVVAALERLRERAPELDLVTEGTRRRLAESLGADLARLGERAAFAGFERERNARPLGAGAYRAFVASQLERGLVPLFVELPVLLRQTAERVEQFVDAWAELVERWRDDRADLAREIGFAPDATIEELEPLDSDRHARGRKVVRVRLSGGVELVYKPRSVAAEARWGALVAALAESGLDDAPPAAPAVEREGYGWMELVRRSDPGDSEVGSSRVDLQACKLEYSIVSPK